MSKRKSNPGDSVQEENGADINALRFNIPLGESKTYEIVAAKQLPTGSHWVIAAQVSKDDIDLDTCTVKGFIPEKGIKAEFLHSLNGELICRPVSSKDA